MDDEALEHFAARAGLEVHWTDAAGKPRKVAPDVLRQVLAAIGYPVTTAGDVPTSEHRLQTDQQSIPPLLTAWAGETFNACGQMMKAPDLPGHYDIQVNG